MVRISDDGRQAAPSGTALELTQGTLGTWYTWYLVHLEVQKCARDLYSFFKMIECVVYTKYDTMNMSL